MRSRFRRRGVKSCRSTRSVQNIRMSAVAVAGCMPSPFLLTEKNLHGPVSGGANRLLTLVAHDATINIADPANNTVAVIKTSFLPLLSIVWLNASQIVGAGHNCCPMLFSSENEGEWKFVDRLDQGKKKDNAQNATGTAFDKFRKMDNHAQVNDGNSAVAKEETVHQNAILYSAVIYLTSADPFAPIKVPARRLNNSPPPVSTVNW